MFVRRLRNTLYCVRNYLDGIWPHAEVKIILRSTLLVIFVLVLYELLEFVIYLLDAADSEFGQIILKLKYLSIVIIVAIHLIKEIYSYSRGKIR